MGSGGLIIILAGGAVLLLAVLFDDEFLVELWEGRKEREERQLV